MHEEVICKVTDYADLIGFEVLGLTYSPIKGPEGNIEYLIYLEKRTDIPEEVCSLSEAEAEDMLRAVMEKKSGKAYGRGMKGMVNSVVTDAHSDLDEAKRTK